MGVRVRKEGGHKKVRVRNVDKEYTQSLVPESTGTGIGTLMATGVGR